MTYGSFSLGLGLGSSLRRRVGLGFGGGRLLRGSGLLGLGGGSGAGSSSRLGLGGRGLGLGCFGLRVFSVFGVLGCLLYRTIVSGTDGKAEEVMIMVGTLTLTAAGFAAGLASFFASLTGPEGPVKES